MSSHIREICGFCGSSDTSKKTVDSINIESAAKCLEFRHESLILHRGESAKNHYLCADCQTREVADACKAWESVSTTLSANIKFQIHVLYCSTDGNRVVSTCLMRSRGCLVRPKELHILLAVTSQCVQKRDCTKSETKQNQNMQKVGFEFSSGAHMRRECTTRCS